MYSPAALAGSIALLIRVSVPSVVQEDLHLLVGEALLAVDGEQDAGAAGLQQALLDASRVHRVAVDEQRAVGEGLAREPERVGVVPLLGAVVEDELEPHVVPLLEVRPRAPRPARRRSR